MNANANRILTLLATSRQNRHRAFIVLSGARAAALRLAAQIIDTVTAGAGSDRQLWLSDADLERPTLLSPKPSRLIGRQIDAAVIDAWSGFDADIFGALAGSVRGGGVLVLCCPRLDEWPQYNDPYGIRFSVFPAQEYVIGNHYLTRFTSLLADDPRVCIVDPETADWDVVRVTDSVLGEEPFALTSDQQQAVDAVLKVIMGQRRRPAVLIADRGRGKSAALGYAAAQLVQQGHKRIVVTAIEPGVVRTLFEHAGAILGTTAELGAGIQYGDASIEYMDPATLGRSTGDKKNVDLVIIDEAAALPLSVLDNIMRHYPRLAMASTVHGYEGSGRGFAVRFDSLLARHTRGRHAVTLSTPVRYAKDDPLENFTFKALLLDAECAEFAAPLNFRADDLSVSWIDRAGLSVDEGLLRQVFGLLVQSHYRTRPNDLRLMLDGANIEIVVVRFGTVVIGAAVVAREGGLDNATCERIWQGQSRPRGHMLSEILSVQVTERNAPELSALRIVRIAVHVDCRRMGVGRRLLKEIGESARERGIDMIGSSFGMGAEVLEFWRSCGFIPLWLGVRRHVASGMRSVLVVNPRSVNSSILVRRARKRFCDDFLLRLAGMYADEEPVHVELLLKGEAWFSVADQVDLHEIARYIAGAASFETSFKAIWAFTRALALSGMLATTPGDDNRKFSSVSRSGSSGNHEVLVRAILQQHGIDVICSEYHLTGRREFLKILANLLDKRLSDVLKYVSRES
ncbi:MAG: tRNA(Met) cytidine acetyltransferase TmcA [marine bacterium B5-7]|nr:MAG: tRNA(Met) cytidine acetyltransferase TmcA [marine bacterium B5-7]